MNSTEPTDAECQEVLGWYQRLGFFRRLRKWWMWWMRHEDYCWKCHRVTKWRSEHHRIPGPYCDAYFGTTHTCCKCGHEQTNTILDQ